MPIKLDDELLVELGLGELPEPHKRDVLRALYEELEMRVGMSLARQMSDRQLTEFEEFIDNDDEAGALRWLENNFPDYRDVVSGEFDRLRSELRAIAGDLSALSMLYDGQFRRETRDYGLLY